jgi:hypothetical protein
MLPLDSPRWHKLKTFTPEPARLPGLVDQWRQANVPKKATALWRELVDFFLHQFSITDAAYAVLPYVAAELQRMPPRQQFDYIVDASLVEAARLLPQAPKMPKDLAASYEVGVRQVRDVACSCLTAGLPKPQFLYLLCSLSNLSGHPQLGQVLFKLGLGDVEIDEIAEFGYIEGAAPKKRLPKKR